jgi:hypothetical protein
MMMLVEMMTVERMTDSPPQSLSTMSVCPPAEAKEYDDGILVFVVPMVMMIL